MTQDRTPQRTVDADAEWTPFGGAARETGATERTVDADARPSTVHAASAGWRPRVIQGGRGHEDEPGQDDTTDEDTSAAEDVDSPRVDVLDAAAADALAIFDAPAPVAPDAAPAAAEPEPEPAAAEATASVLTAPAAASDTAAEAPAAPAQEATPHPTLHTPDPATTEAPAQAQSVTEPAETPHSTPWWKAAVGWLNPYEVLDQPLPPVSAIYETAWDSVTDRSGFDRATEIAWVYVLGMPVTVACYTLAAAAQQKMRGLGVAATVVLWTTAANTAPVDTTVLWAWTVVGYWLSTALVLPVLIQAKK